jgi:hypothetical protein
MEGPQAARPQTFEERNGEYFQYNKELVPLEMPAQEIFYRLRYYIKPGATRFVF